MILTPPELASDVYDVCVIGAGPAGITLALELEPTGMGICLLEAGGETYEPRAQRLLEGTMEGDRYPPLRDTRLSALGGTSHVWAGWCRPLDPIDFDPRPGRDGCGWPLGASDLEPYYRRAHEYLGLGAFDYDAPGDALRDDLLPIRPADVAHAVFRVVPRQLGARYRGRLEVAQNVHLVLHSPVMRLRMNPGGDCDGACVRGPDGRDLRIRARRYVLAAGGIENARLLLLSAESPESAPGNSADVLGRYFTDHPFANVGTMHLNAPRALTAYFPRRPAGDTAGPGVAPQVRTTLSLPRHVLEQEGSLNAALFFHPRYEAHEVFDHPEVAALLEVWNKLRGKAVPGGLRPYLQRAVRAPHRLVVAGARKLLIGAGPGRTWRCRAMFETESRAENRVTLGVRRDALDRPLAHVDWHLSELDLLNMRSIMGRFDRALRSTGIGWIEFACQDTADGWRSLAEGGKHHMGTTRMHVSPRSGVVDADCRVHGVSNLYVAGSSVFPSGGYANPTLTIVALAIRLGDHLRNGTTT